MDDARLTRFKTPDDARRFDALYARLRAERWPSPPDEADIATALGTAHTYSWPGTGTPVLLVPGWGGTAVMWAPMLAHGFGGRPVHALDLVGDVGLSVQRRPITASTDHLSWLDAVVDGLGLDRIHVVGSSYGGPWPDASHTMPADDAELVATRIRTFLDHVDSTRPADPDHAT